MQQLSSLPEDARDRTLLAALAVGEAIWDWDVVADRLYLSPAFCAMLSIPSDGNDLRPDRWFDRVHVDDRQWLESTLRAQVSAQDRRFAIEHRWFGPGDTLRWLLVRGRAIGDLTGKVVRLVGTAIDITDRKAMEESLRLSDERYALVAAATNDGLFDWDLRTDRIYYAPRWAALIGLEDSSIGDRPEAWLDRVHPEDLIWLQATLEAQVTGAGKPFQIEYRIRHATGIWRWMHCRGVAVPGPNGEPVRLVGSQSDVTDRKLAEEQLRQSEERYALASRGANDGLWDWSIAENQVYCSSRWTAMLGLEGDERTGPIEEWFALIDPRDLPPPLRADLELHLSGGSDHLQHELRIRHQSGAELWVLVRGIAVLDGSGRAVRMAGSMTDITARKRAEHQLLYDAFHDGLTGLPNRALLLDRIGQTVDRRRRPEDAQFAVLLLNLDHFKDVNDSLGPMVGDQVLRLVAGRLETDRRTGDTVARVSGDEFGVLMDGLADVKAAVSAAQRLIGRLQEPVELADGTRVNLTSSVGLAMSNTGYRSAADMLRDASLAMFRAKAAGRNRIEVFDDALRERAIGRLRTESDLRNAIANSQLVLHYQPIVRLRDRRIAGFEALIRWNYPERGLIPPSDFITLAEETGLILGIGRWVLTESARRLADWQRRFREDLFVSVNVSGRQILDDDVPAAVGEVLAETGIPASCLRLEITESLLLDDPTRCAAVMERLRTMGVRISLDDFGTGYSSLSYLHRFPVDTLKIDRSFVRATGSGDRRAEIARIITMLAQALDLDVVAEGIEDEMEVAFLRGLHCHYGQGYLFAKPLPADEATAALATGLNSAGPATASPVTR